MTKVIGVQAVLLHTGVDPATFEAFIARSIPVLTPWPGMKSYVVKGERGNRAGQFALIFEFADLATRNRYFPQPDVIGPEAQEYLSNWLPFVTEWQQYATWAGSPTVFTDYLVVGEF